MPICTVIFSTLLSKVKMTFQDQIRQYPHNCEYSTLFKTVKSSLEIFLNLEFTQIFGESENGVHKGLSPIQCGTRDPGMSVVQNAGQED